jgi:hypothetical protein
MRGTEPVRLRIPSQEIVNGDDGSSMVTGSAVVNRPAAGGRFVCCLAWLDFFGLRPRDTGMGRA